MRRIGLLGGMSWSSTAEYYRLINAGVATRLGGLHSADLAMVSVDFEEIASLQREDRWTEAGERLAREARTLQDAGASAVLLCTNTMHKVAEQIEEALDIPLLHLADATARRVLESGLGQVALLGTAFTMEQDFYRTRLEAHGLEVLTPEAAGRADVHRIIFDELCRGEVRPESANRFLEVVAALVSRGAEGVILGCTEIELLLDPANTPQARVPLFATTAIHAAAAVDWALGE